MTAARSDPVARRTGAIVSPFVAFGLVAIAAAIGAMWEMAYYAGNSVLSAGTLGTTVGIGLALVAFFLWGLRAPSNE